MFEIQKQDVPEDGFSEAGDPAPRSTVQATHLLHFEPLTAGDAGLDIPCDASGCVGLDALGDKLRNDYFFARTLIGRLFAAPTVRRLARPLTARL